MDWENHSEKKCDPKNFKKDENQTGIAACEQKITSEKVNFRFLSLF